jgi:two-component system OmpR family sensor kinase
MAVVEVMDNGPGMTRDQAGRAFERFYRADPGRARDRGGSGLGLAIVQAVTLAHGGGATLASVPGEGTTVRVELPLAPDGAG